MAIAGIMRWLNRSSARLKKNGSENASIKPGIWPGPISSITLKSSTTGPGATVTSAASVRRPLNRPRREDRICLQAWGQSSCRAGSSTGRLSSALWVINPDNTITTIIPSRYISWGRQRRSIRNIDTNRPSWNSHSRRLVTWSSINGHISKKIVRG